MESLKMDLEEIFHRFDNYNFKGDGTFLAGLEYMKKKHGPEDSNDWLTKAQIFYYNKFVEPINLENYLSWKRETDVNEESAISTRPDQANSSSSHEIQGEDQVDSESGSAACATISRLENFGSLEISSCSDVKSGDEHSTQGALAKSEIPLVQQPGSSSAESSASTLSGASEQTDSRTSDKGAKNVWVSPDEESTMSFAEIMECIESGRPVPGVKEVEVQPMNKDPTTSTMAKKKKPWED